MEVYRRASLDKTCLHVIDIEPDGTLNVWVMEKHRTADGRMDEHFCGAASLTRGELLAYAKKTFGWEEIAEAECEDASVIWNAKEQQEMEAKLLAALDMAQSEPEPKKQKKSFLSKLFGR